MSLVADVGAQAASASEQLSGHSASVAGAIETLETAQMPELVLPPEAADGLAGSAVQFGLDQIAAALETGRAAALEPLRELQATLTDLAEMVEAVGGAATLLSELLTDAIQQLSEMLAQTGSLSEALGLLLDQSLEVAAAGEGADSLPGLASSWRQLVPLIDEAAARAQAGL